MQVTVPGAGDTPTWSDQRIKTCTERHRGGGDHTTKNQHHEVFAGFRANAVLLSFFKKNTLSYQELPNDFHTVRNFNKPY